VRLRRTKVCRLGVYREGLCAVHYVAATRVIERHQGVFKLAELLVSQGV